MPVPVSSAGLMAKTFAVYAKDLRLELRNRYATSIVLMFAITTLTVISFSIGRAGLDPRSLAALFWIVMFFSAMAGLAQVFIREEAAGTALALRLRADPTAVFLGKFFFNLTLLASITVIIAPLFFVLTDATTTRLPSFIILLVLGVIGLCAATTLVAAIIAKAATRGALFSVLAFPILIALLLMLVGGTAKVFSDASFGDVSMEIQGLIAYSAIMLTASLLLFRFVWRD